MTSAYTRHRKATALARWLGPWADATATPSDVERTLETVAPHGSMFPPADGAGVGPLRLYRYEPKSGEVSGCYVVLQGLHYAGPDDARLDRFCRVLAAAGFCVVAPFLRDFCLLRVTPEASFDAAIATDHAIKLCAQRGLPRPALFSISFGCIPAIDVAGSDRHRDAIGALVIFGGFHDFHATIRFCVTARAFDGDREVAVPHDPVNGPAVFVNLVDHLDARDPEAMKAAWLAMARATWGQRHKWPLPIRRPIGERIAETLAPDLRELFMIGCGLAPGAATVLEVGLARAERKQHFGFTDPRPGLSRVGVPVVIGHGRDDDVIPFTEADKLRASLPSDLPHRLHITGMYGHTGSALPTPGAIAGEAGTLIETLYSIVDAPHDMLR